MPPEVSQRQTDSEPSVTHGDRAQQHPAPHAAAGAKLGSQRRRAVLLTGGYFIGILLPKTAANTQIMLHAVFKSFIKVIQHGN